MESPGSHPIQPIRFGTFCTADGFASDDGPHAGVRQRRLLPLPPSRQAAKKWWSSWRGTRLQFGGLTASIDSDLSAPTQTMIRARPHRWRKRESVRGATSASDMAGAGATAMHHIAGGLASGLPQLPEYGVALPPPAPASRLPGEESRGASAAEGCKRAAIGTWPLAMRH